MAESVKKPRATRSKTATTVKKTAGAGQPTPINGPSNGSGHGSGNGSAPSHEQIADLARKYWAQRGYTDGHQEEDWLRAEQELRAKAS